jgi:hypothetical protein
MRGILRKLSGTTPKRSKNVNSVITDTGDGKSIIVFPPDCKPLVATDQHPAFKAIEKMVADDDPAVFNLFTDAPGYAIKQFERLSERVSVRDRIVLFDNEPLEESISSLIVRLLEDRDPQWMAIVNFLEKLHANPSENSRKQLYGFLDKNDFTITPDGDFVGYKSVQRRSDGVYESIHSGPAIVDGVPVHGKVPNKIGSIVELERSKVVDNPGVGCSMGLHVGTWKYAHGFSGDTVLEVHVNPRDVVSVPTSDEKIRCCRYKVIRVLKGRYEQPVLDTSNARVLFPS